EREKNKQKTLTFCYFLEPCYFDGRLFRDGEDWRLGRCSKCVCRDGVTQCFTASCEAVLCKQDEVLVMSPGKCCPECVPKSCSVSGKVYQGKNKVQRSGKCCEECVSSKEKCLYDGTIRYHGEMWNITRCDFCTCDEGQVTCHKAECAKVECAKVRKVFFFENVPIKSCDCFTPFFFPFKADILRQKSCPSFGAAFVHLP
ncbi:hypothetical protein CIB84_009760, partial [Bambusicola thoracicus]